jgi:hypothetical protein
MSPRLKPGAWSVCATLVASLSASLRREIFGILELMHPDDRRPGVRIEAGYIARRERPDGHIARRPGGWLQLLRAPRLRSPTKRAHNNKPTSFEELTEYPDPASQIPATLSRA